MTADGGSDHPVTASDFVDAKRAVDLLMRLGLCEPAERDLLWTIQERIEKRVRDLWRDAPEVAPGKPESSVTNPHPTTPAQAGTGLQDGHRTV